MNLSYDVRIQGILVHKGKKSNTYTVRWVVAKKPFRAPFATKALAESRRSRLMVHQREGVAFDASTGLPEPEARRRNDRTWLAHSMDYVDARWKDWSPKHRRNTADALATITLASRTGPGGPSDKALRAALTEWAYNSQVRAALSGSVPPEHDRSMDWLAAHSPQVTNLDDAELLRKVLDQIALRIDGKPAAATTVSRKRAALSGCLGYAVELRRLSSHPLTRVAWQAPATDEVVDRRRVVNPAQAARLIDAAGKVMPDLKAFYGCLYYASLRPEEVRHLREGEYEPPAAKGEFGWLNLTGASVEVAALWGDHDGATEDRALKHRARTSTRRVPVVPELAELLDAHLRGFGTGPDGRIFVSRRGPGGRYLAKVAHPVTSNTYGRVWKLARTVALTEAQAASPLAQRPYDLRHAGVSLWLNAGVPATQVAEWAGHSVNVLLRVYAKCIDGQENAAQQRIIEELSRGQSPSTRNRHDE